LSQILEPEGKGVITTMLTVYLSGWLITTSIAVIATTMFGAGRELRPVSRGLLAVWVSAAWPVLVIGAIQFAVIAMIARSFRIASLNEPELRATDEAEHTDDLVST
jgi:hypothetical protein